MMLVIKKISTVLLSLGLLMPSAAILAANDGDVGEKSTGKIKAKVTVKQEYIISGLQDYTIEPFTAGPTTQALAGNAENICIGTNDMSLKAGVTVSGDSNGDGFFMPHAQDTSKEITYTLTINDGNTNHEMIPEKQTTMIASPIEDCHSGTNTHTLQLTIKAGQESLIAGEYSSNLTFIVEAPTNTISTQ
jgi:hypothetical protein